MKIGICASTFSKNGFGRFGDETYLKLKEYGFSATDFGLENTESVFYTASKADSDGLLKRERKLSDSAGVEISQVHGPWRFPPKDDTEEDRKERMEKMKISIRAATLLGAKNWVIHPIMPFGLQDTLIGKEEETRDLNFTFFAELLKTAKDYGVIICLENMPFTRFSLSSPQKILEIVNGIADDNMRICLDTGHVNVLGLDLAEETYRVKDKLQALHVHDNKHRMDLHLLPFEGDIKWEAFGKALKDIGYGGVFSLETNPPHGLDNQLFERSAKFYCDVAKSIIG